MTEYIDLDHTGKILQEECMEFDKLSHNAFAKAIGVVPSRITNIVNGRPGHYGGYEPAFNPPVGQPEGYFLRIQEI